MLYVVRRTEIGKNTEKTITLLTITITRRNRRNNRRNSLRAHAMSLLKIWFYFRGAKSNYMEVNFDTILASKF